MRKQGSNRNVMNKNTVIVDDPSIHPAEPGRTDGWMDDPEAHQHRIAVEQNAEDIDLLPEGLRAYLIQDRDLVRLDGKALKKQGLSLKKLFTPTVLIPGRSDPRLLQEAREF